MKWKDHIHSGAPSEDKYFLIFHQCKVVQKVTIVCLDYLIFCNLQFLDSFLIFPWGESPPHLQKKILSVQVSMSVFVKLKIKLLIFFNLGKKWVAFLASLKMFVKPPFFLLEQKKLIWNFFLFSSPNSFFLLQIKYFTVNFHFSNNSQ